MYVSSKRAIFILFLALLAHDSNGFFRSKVDKLKNRAKGYYRKHFKKDKKWHFLGLDPTLYPGLNQGQREDNQNKWDSYYKCLQEQEQTLGEHGIQIPEAVQGFEGGHMNPAEDNRTETVEWYFGEVGKEYLSIVFYSEHILLSPEDKTLHIYNLKSEHSGQYVCIMGDSATVPYYLNVVTGDSELRQVHSKNALKPPFPKEDHSITDYNLKITTEWGDWSECSTCKTIGRKHRLGYCNLLHETPRHERSAKTFWLEAKHALLNESYTFKKPHGKAKKNETAILPRHLNLLKVFQFGIPCRSFILPPAIRDLQEVATRQDEVMVGYCKVACKKAEIFVVKDKQGREIERVNNSAGIYSTVQGVPPTTPEVERLVQYERRDTDIVLTCPGNLNSDAPIKWLLGGKEVVAEVIAEESKGRVFISLLERIHIKKAKVSDSNLYSCWQNNELAGTVRLVVENKIKLTFNHHVMLVGMLLILSVFVYIFLKALTNRKHARAALV